MTKKDFELIAGVLRAELQDYDAGEDVTPWIVVKRFADALQHTNPRFDRERFIAAATGQDSRDSAGRLVRYS